MSNDVKKEFIYVTYKKYAEELKGVWLDSGKKWVKWRDILLVVNSLLVGIFMIVGIVNFFKPVNEIFIYLYLAAMIILLIIGAYVALKADKLIYSDEGYRCRIKAINKIITEENHKDIIKMLTIEETFSIFESIKDFLVKVVGILSIGFGVIRPIVEKLLQPFLDRLLEGSNILAGASIEQISNLAGSTGVVIILVLLGILLLWVGIIGLIKLYDRLIKLFHLTSYSKSCELITVYQLRKYYYYDNELDQTT